MIANAHRPSRTGNPSSPQKDESLKLTQNEYRFLAHLLLNVIPIKDLIKLTPKQALAMDEQPINPKELVALLDKIRSKELDLPVTCKSAIPVIVSEPDNEGLVTGLIDW